MSMSQNHSHHAHDVPRSPRSDGLARALMLVIPLSATLFLSACAGNGLELAALSAADPAGDGAASSTSPSAASPTSAPIETGSLPPVGKATAKAAAAEETASPDIVKARQLRANGDLVGAMGVLDKASKSAPKDKALLRERGLLALEMGRIAEAKTLLRKADDAKSPDWRIKSALGSAHAASGEQPAAQREFAAALQLAPDHPSILNNLALSYALDGRHEQAEQLLRRASRSKAAAPKANQNLALLLGLKGEIAEARKVSETALPRAEAHANISYLERLQSGPRVSRAEPRATSDTAGSTTLGALMPPN